MASRVKRGARRRVVAPRLDDWVALKRAAGWSTAEVVDHGTAEFEVDQSTVIRAIVRVRAEDAARAAQLRDVHRADHLARLNLAWRIGVEERDVRGLAMVAKRYQEVQGIEAVKKLEHSGVVGLQPVAAMSPQEREREIQLLMAKRQAALAPGLAPTIAPAPVTVIDVESAELEIEIAPDIRPKSKQRSKAKAPKKPRVH